jgi:hypothetical protein
MEAFTKALESPTLSAFCFAGYALHHAVSLTKHAFSLVL